MGKLAVKLNISVDIIHTKNIVILTLKIFNLKHAQKVLKVTDNSLTRERLHLETTSVYLIHCGSSKDGKL